MCYAIVQLCNNVRNFGNVECLAAVRLCILIDCQSPTCCNMVWTQLLDFCFFDCSYDSIKSWHGKKLV